MRAPIGYVPIAWKLASFLILTIKNDKINGVFVTGGHALRTGNCGKFLQVLAWICAGQFMLSSCSTDIHYDAVTSNLVINVDEASTQSGTVTVRQRFVFDRDLVPLSSMTLTEAWISAPELDTSKLACDAAGDCAGFDLSLIDSIGISLVESGSTDTTFWLFASPDSRTREAALFSEMNVGDLRSYMGDTVYMELEIKIDPNEYHFLRYWRDYCGMSDDCQLAFPLSMQFKMED